MSLRVVFRAAARHEFEAATAWYDQQRKGLGEEFLREIDEVVLRAAAHPERYPIVFSNVRKARRAALSIRRLLSKQRRMPRDSGGLSRTTRPHDLAPQDIAFCSDSPQ